MKQQSKTKYWIIVNDTQRAIIDKIYFNYDETRMKMATLSGTWRIEEKEMWKK